MEGMDASESGGHDMDTVDVKGLPEEEARLVQQFVDFLRIRTQRHANERQGPAQKVEIACWPAKIKGKLTREEIYEDR